MPVQHVFEYAVVRIVPRVERGEFINAGVVLFCRTLRFLDARTSLDAERLLAFGAEIDTQAVAALLDHWTLICRGDAGAGELGGLPQPERFRWITAPRSTIVQPSAVHCGICRDPAAQLDALFGALVAPPRPAAPPPEPSPAPACSTGTPSITTR